jgi:hypothetical protein
VTTADPDGGARARVISCLVASVPGLDTAVAQRALAAARADYGRALREVDALLTENPAALVTTPAAYPLALVRLAHALIGAGYQTLAAPACAGCGKITTDLRRSTASGRVCGTCAARGSAGTCARCGRSRRISARRSEGGICSACYDKDEQVVTECSGCGRRRRAAARMPDGSARCQFCATRPARTCSACGQQRTVAGTTDAGPVCASCYQAPQRPCGRCGQTRKIAQAGNNNRPRLVLQLLQRSAGGLLGLRRNPALPADLLGQPDLPHLPDPPSPAVLPVRARPPGPSRMARRTGLCRLLRACPPPPRPVRGLRGGAAADRHR